MGGTFLHFQWDILLLEAGLLAVLAAPGRGGRQQTSGSQDPVTMFLVRWLLFRMMFASGVVKVGALCLLELETEVHPKVRNHGEGPY